MSPDEILENLSWAHSLREYGYYHIPTLPGSFRAWCGEDLMAGVGRPRLSSPPRYSGDNCVKCRSKVWEAWLEAAFGLPRLGKYR